MSCQMIFLSIKSKMSFQINQITNGGIVHDSKDHAFRGRKRDSLFMRTLNGAGWLDKVEFLPSNNNRLGDINTDGSVDISDVILDLRIALGLDEPRPCSDINGDGNVDISDVILTLRMALGLDELKQCM